MKNNRPLLKVLMDAAIVAINDTISYRHRDGRLVAGAIVVLHPFSKKMSFNPHPHLLVTEGGFDKHDNFIRQKYIPFNAMRKTWQYHVLTQFKAALPKNVVFSILIDRLFKKYRKGFYVYLPKEARITNKKRIAKYVARYIRHPAVANTTIRTDTMEKRSHSGMGVMMAREFIKALIQHIPDRNFKMIRYYDEYSRIIKGKYSGYFRELYKTSDI